MRIIGIIFPVFAIAGIGLVYARNHRPDMSHANKLNMDVFVPALVFSALASKSFDITDYGALALGGVLVVLGSGLVVLPLVPLLKVQWRTFVPPMMFCNSGNMGIPLMIFAFGDDAVQAAVVLFMLSNLLHFSLGVSMLDRHSHPLLVFKTPVVLASLAGIAVSLLGVEIPGPIYETVELLGQISVPLLLFSLGVRLLDVDFREWRLGLVSAVAGPASGIILVLLLRPWLDLDPIQSALLIIFGGLPPAVLNYMFAERYHQEPEKVASMVMLANMASILIMPLVLAFALTEAGI